MVRVKNNQFIEAQIHEAISGMIFPARPAEIISCAKDQGGSQDVINILEKLPNLEYRNEPHLLSTLREYLYF